MQVDTIKNIINEAKTAANKASREYLDVNLKGEDNYPCGFAWVNIYDIKGNTKLGRAMKQAGLEKDYSGAYNIWNPGSINVQNVDVKSAGAKAAADVFTSYGFKAFAGSRLD
jgi:hypothetical protein